MTKVLLYECLRSTFCYIFIIIVIVHHKLKRCKMEHPTHTPPCHIPISRMEYFDRNWVIGVAGGQHLRTVKHTLARWTGEAAESESISSWKPSESIRALTSFDRKTVWRKGSLLACVLELLMSFVKMPPILTHQHRYQWELEFGDGHHNRVGSTLMLSVWDGMAYFVNLLRRSHARDILRTFLSPTHSYSIRPKVKTTNRR